MKNCSKKKGYKFYPCMKDGNNGGVILDGCDTAEEAYARLVGLKGYITNKLVFIGVVKCRDERPLDHILDIGYDCRQDAFKHK